MCSPAPAPARQGKTVVAITSGANINFERLRLVSELANVGALTEATLTTTIPERAGAFSCFVDTISRAAAATASSNGSGDTGVAPPGPAGIQLTEFKYR